MSDFGTVNEFAIRWLDVMGGRSYEIAIAFSIAACLWFPLSRKASAYLGYGLFMLVLIKAVLPFSIPSPAPLNEFFNSSHTFSIPMRDWGMRPVFPPMSQELSHSGEIMETADIENAGELRSSPVTDEGETVGRRNKKQISFSALFMLVWLAVVCFLLIRFIRSQWTLHRFILRAKQGPPVDFPFDFGALKKQIGLRCNIQVVSSDAISIPFVWGIFRPHLIVPHNFLGDFSENQMRWIVLHELSHIKRHDLLISTLQRLAQIIYFFHPAVWIANWTINQQKEYICDDIAITACQTPRMDCGQSILSLIKQVNRHPVVEAGLLGGFRNSSLIRRRIMRILDEKRALRVKYSIGIVFVLILAACVTLPSVGAGDDSAAPAESSNSETTSTDSVPIYGRKLITLSEEYVESFRPDSERPVHGTKPDEDWDHYNALRDASRWQSNPAWSPDGSLIAFVGWGGTIYTVPADGGVPTKLWDGNTFYEYQGKQYYMNQSRFVRSLVFSPDGTEVLFSARIIDEERGTVVTPHINEEGSYSGVRMQGSIAVIRAVNIATGETRIVVDGGREPQFSRNGKYLSYWETRNRGITVRELATDTEWVLEEVPMSNTCFSGNGNYIIYVQHDQFYRIPVTGGEKEQISFDESSTLITRRYFPDSSPAGDYVLFDGNAGPRSNTFYNEDGSKRGGYSTTSMEKISVLSVEAGLSFPLVPIEGGAQSSGAKFSPDGTKICYAMINKDVRGSHQEIYIQEFDGVSFTEQTRVGIEQPASSDLP